MTYIDTKNDGAVGRARIADEAAHVVPAAPSPIAAKGHSSSAEDATMTLPDAAPNDGESLALLADKAVMTVPSPSTKSRAGHSNSADKANSAVPVSAPHEAEEGQSLPADNARWLVPSSASLDALAELQVRRKHYISTVNKQTNAAKGLVRRALNWRFDEEKGAREKVNSRAAQIVAAALAGKPQKPEDAETFNFLAFDIATTAAGIEPYTKARHGIELEMKRIVRRLPVYAWAKNVKGLGELGLAVVLAEAGDLSNYPKKGHLWKRLGLAPFEGRAYSTWRMKGGLTADQWTDAGYSPRRRAEVYAVVSEPLFRAQSVAAGPYRAVYDRRRALTAETNADWTKAHSHMDALRVMTKILLRDLWKEWRQAKGVLPNKADVAVPAAETNRREARARVAGKPITALPTGEQNERKAEGLVPAKAVVELPTAHPIAADLPT